MNTDLTYEDGVAHMKALTESLAKSVAGTKEENKPYIRMFNVGQLLISYPGRKHPGDYKVTEYGVAIPHTAIVKDIYKLTTKENFDEVSKFLSRMYSAGLAATGIGNFSQQLKEKIFWVTLQEEINYPPPRYSGRKMPFQRYYEAALIKSGDIIENNKKVDLLEVLNRTNNHGGRRPKLFNIGTRSKPPFYY